MNRLIAFLYLLMRDTTPAGAVADILNSIEGATEFRFSNPELRDLATRYASKLSGIPNSATTWQEERRMLPQEKIAAHVKARNICHQTANSLYHEVSEALKPFIGQQILKTNGGFLAKVEKVLPQFPNSLSLLVYHSATQKYTLVWGIRACVTVEGRSFYEEMSVHVAALDNGVCTNLLDFEELRTDYTTEEVLQKMAAVKVAEKALDAARSALHPFEGRLG